MKLAVLGATGATGRLVVDVALARGHEVVALVRTPTKLMLEHERLSVRRADVTDAASLEAGLAGTECVASCIGSTTTRPPITIYSAGTAKVLQAMSAQGVKRFVALSSGGLTLGRDPHNPWFFDAVIKRFFLKHVYDDMRRMEELVQASDIDWTLIRPSRLTDKPGAAPLREVENGYTLPKGFWTARDRLAELVVDKCESGDASGKALGVAN